MRAGFAAVAIQLLCGLQVLAQDNLSLKQATIGPSDSAPCDTYYFTRPGADTRAEWKSVAVCTESVLKLVTEARQSDSTPALNERLIRLRANYKRLKPWVPRSQPSPVDDDWIRARKALDELNIELDRTLKRHGLFEQFSASLVSGPVFLQDAGETSAGEAATEKEAPTAVGAVVWQSRHFGDEEYQTFDISFGGRIGFQPVLTMTEVAADAEAGTDAGLVPTHQSALNWTFGTQFNRQHRGVNAETTVFARTGANHLLKLPKAVDRGADSVLVLPVENEVGKTAWLWEAGLEFTMFDNRLEQLHAEKGMTSPQFQLSLSWRHDSRFNQEGPLAEFERPEHRLVFRMMLDAIKVFDRRQIGEPAKPFTFGFAVEHERSLRGGSLRIPSATRIMLRGDLNLLRALSGESPAQKEEARRVPASVPPAGGNNPSR